MLVIWDGDVSEGGEEAGMLNRSASVAQTRGGAGRGWRLLGLDRAGTAGWILDV